MPNQILKLTNKMGNKSIPKLCKLNLMSLCHGAGKIRFISNLLIGDQTPIIELVGAVIDLGTFSQSS